MSSTYKIKSCELLNKLETKISELQSEYEDKFQELEELSDNEGNMPTIEELNEEIYDLLDDIYFYKNIIKKINKKQHYKCLSLAK